MCSIINCTYNESPLSSFSTLHIDASQEQSGTSACEHSFTTPEVHSDDSSSSPESLTSPDSSSEVDLLSLHPDNQLCLIFVLCFAVEMLSSIKRLMHQDCMGCFYTSLSQRDHSCFIKTRQEAINIFFFTAMDTFNEDNLKRRLRTFAWKPTIYREFHMPTNEEFDDLMKLCRGNWTDYIYEILHTKFNSFCEHAIQHAQR